MKSAEGVGTRMSVYLPLAGQRNTPSPTSLLSVRSTCATLGSNPTPTAHSSFPTPTASAPSQWRLKSSATAVSAASAFAHTAASLSALPSAAASESSDCLTSPSPTVSGSGVSSYSSHSLVRGMRNSRDSLLGSCASPTDSSTASPVMGIGSPLISGLSGVGMFERCLK